MKFEDVYTKYLDYIEYRLKGQSKRTLKERFEKKLLPYWKDYNIHDITVADYMEWQKHIYSFNYSHNYNINLHYLMSGFFEYCIKFYDLEFNIARKCGNFKNVSNKKTTYKTYNIKQFKKFIKNLDNKVYKNFFTFMYFTGTRPGEAMALKFENLGKKIVYIEHSIDEHGSREIDTPKTDSSKRAIFIDRKLYKSLLKLKKYYIKKYGTWNDDYFVFGGIKPLSPTTINRYKLKACEKANLYSIKLHEFRHSHATLLDSKNIPISVIKDRLGHSTVNTTMNVYIHSDNSKQEKRVTRTLGFLRLFI